VRLSVITDEISQDLESALGVCEDSGVGTVELRAVGGANIISHDQSSLKRIKATLEDRDFDVCAISSPFLKCHLQGDGPPGGRRTLQPRLRERSSGTSSSAPWTSRVFLVHCWCAPSPSGGFRTLRASEGRWCGC
jgi:hypothetical protein